MPSDKIALTLPATGQSLHGLLNNENLHYVLYVVVNVTNLAGIEHTVAPVRNVKIHLRKTPLLHQEEQFENILSDTFLHFKV